MNEPASFQQDRPVPAVRDRFDFPPYQVGPPRGRADPQIDNAHGALWEKTVAPSARLADGTRHYHQHNLFGHWHA